MSRGGNLPRADKVMLSLGRSGLLMPRESVSSLARIIRLVCRRRWVQWAVHRGQRLGLGLMWASLVSLPGLEGE